MAVRDVLEYPAEQLRAVAEPVATFDKQLSSLIADLSETLAAGTGIGLAAPQLGVPKRVLALTDEQNPSAVRVFVNPEIIEVQTPCIVEERCLSLPGLVGRVFRYADARCRYQSETGEWCDDTLSGMPAVCLQHELEHLDGRLFLDRLSAFKRWRYHRVLRQGNADRAA
ncbi:MAG: peptide deformylase [Pseudomonadota bacterium]